MVQQLPVTTGAAYVAISSASVTDDGSDGFERIGEEYGVPEMSFLYYDDHRDELWFADTTALVRYDGHAFTRYDTTDGYRLAGLPRPPGCF